MSSELTRRSFLGAATLGCAAAGLVRAAAQEPNSPQQGSFSEIIDCHVHLKHGDATRSEWSPETIIELLDQVGIRRAVVFAMCTTTVRSIEMAADAAKKYPDRLIPFLYALPSYERPVLEDIRRAIEQQGFRGIKMHAGECTLAEYIVDPVLRLAGSLAVPCLIDCAGNAAAATRMAETFPHTQFWFAHMGKYMATDPQLVDQFIRVAERSENVSLDLSGVALLPKIEEAVSRLGAKRLVWGTDGPYKNPEIATYAQAELDKIRRLQIDESDKQLILGGNVARVLNLR